MVLFSRFLNKMFRSNLFFYKCEFLLWKFSCWFCLKVIGVKFVIICLMMFVSLTGCFFKVCVFFILVSIKSWWINLLVCFIFLKICFKFCFNCFWLVLCRVFLVFIFKMVSGVFNLCVVIWVKCFLCCYVCFSLLSSWFNVFIKGKSFIVGFLI